MAVTKNDLQDFQRFADEKLSNGGAESLHELVTQWEAARQRAETNAAIREAIDQLNAGLGEPLDVAMEDIRQRLDLPAE